MKKFVLITSIILLLFLSAPTVKSAVVKHYEKVEEKYGIQTTKGTCYVPPWTECPDGYICEDYYYGWLEPLGKKVGWNCFSYKSDLGLNNYKVRIVIDILLGYYYTVTSKALFNGTYVLNITPAGRISGMKSSLDFNYSYPGPAYVFEPSYVYGENAAYLECAIMWLNFTQTDNVTIGLPILYKMYITDLNRDNAIDIYDGIILSNNYGKKWSLPVDANNNTWRADMNSDGIVNTLDSTILRNQFGKNYIKPEGEGIFLNIWEPMWVNTRDCS